MSAAPTQAPAAGPDVDLAPELPDLGLTDIAVLSCLTEAGLALSEQVQLRHDCLLQLVAVNGDGSFGGAALAWAEAAQASLIAAGVAPARLRVVARSEDLRPADLIVNLQGFGCGWKARHLQPFIDRGLTAESRILGDIRKGSGAYPMLNKSGSCDTLLDRTDGNDVARVLFTPNPPASAPEAGGDTGDASWAEIAMGLAGPDGFYRDDGKHSFLFVPRGDTLVVTFDNLDIAMGKRDDRRPWGYTFIEKQGWSMLGVMANGWTWYRDDWVGAQFDALAAQAFFARFKRVVFYGASMGGYAACAFSGAHPGATVVAISPQSTLDKAVVPWETRYKTAWNRDFTGRYGDAALVSGAADRVMLFYDPYEPLDAGHADGRRAQRRAAAHAAAGPPAGVQPATDGAP